MSTRAGRSWLAQYDPHVPAHFAPAMRDGVELFERAVRDRPDDPAILYFETAISHRDAGHQAHALATALSRELRLRPGDRVALMLQNVPQVVIAVHAVWLAGGVVTTVNPMNKRRELEHQLADAGVRIALCLESLFEVVDGARAGTPLEHIITVVGARPRSTACRRRSPDTSDRVPPPRTPAHRPAARGTPATRRSSDARPGRPRAAHLHLRHHRPAEGRDQHPRRDRAQRRGDDALVRARAAAT